MFLGSQITIHTPSSLVAISENQKIYINVCEIQRFLALKQAKHTVKWNLKELMSLFFFGKTIYGIYSVVIPHPSSFNFYH